MHSRFTMVSVFSKTAPIKWKRKPNYFYLRNGDNDNKPISETLKGLCHAAVQFILFNFSNYSPSIAMELKVSKEITCK